MHLNEALQLLHLKGGTVVKAFTPTHVVGCQCHLWVEFGIGSLLYSERFLLGTPVFPSPLNKATFPNPNLTGNVRQRTLHGCATFKLLFIYLLILFKGFPLGTPLQFLLSPKTNKTKF